MNSTIVTYLIYGITAIGLTGWLARTLYRNGTLFLQTVFDDNAELAGAVNHLLVVGFYMLNLGWAFLIFRTDPAADAVDAAAQLVAKLGLLLVTLGIIHFANMFVFWRIRRRAGRPTTYQPPVAPTTTLPAPPVPQWGTVQ